jgi:hypothetical protein
MNIREIKGLIALGCTPGFAAYASRSILEKINLKRELQTNGALFYMLISTMRRHDRKAAFQFVIDWSNPNGLPMTRVTRFQPGQHYHVLGRKFDKFSEAVEFLEKSGYRFGGTDVTRIELAGE